MNGFEKATAVENALEHHDAIGAKKVLSTITDRIDQDIFMTVLAGKMRDHQGSDVPKLSIVEDKAGHVQSITSGDTTVKSDMSVQQNGHDVSGRTFMDNLRAAVGLGDSAHTGSAATEKPEVPGIARTLAHCLEVTNTSNSCENHRLQVEEKAHGL